MCGAVHVVQGYTRDQLSSILQGRGEDNDYPSVCGRRLHFSSSSSAARYADGVEFRGSARSRPESPTTFSRHPISELRTPALPSMTAEHQRLDEANRGEKPWRQ